jgi:hypothetical protein
MLHFVASDSNAPLARRADSLGAFSNRALGDELIRAVDALENSLAVQLIEQASPLTNFELRDVVAARILAFATADETIAVTEIARHEGNSITWDPVWPVSDLEMETQKLHEMSRRVEVISFPL